MYVELHCHSAFSFLDGASLPDELVPAALNLGYDAVALTDHNTVSGSMEFAVTARALGLRAIHGAEIELDDGRHLTLLVQDERGWANLCRILTRAHAHTRESRGPPTLANVPLQQVLDNSEGLVCLSGCALRGIHDELTLRRLRDAFGVERLRIELQRPFLRDDRARNRQLSELGRRLGVARVATGNVHAHTRTRALLQDAFVAIRLHSTLDASEPQRRGNFSHVLASPGEMAARFPEHPEAVAETRRLADSLRFELDTDLGYRYPGSEDALAMRKLIELCDSRLDHRYAGAPDDLLVRAKSRLEEELRIIGKLKLPGFFLLHHDLLELARQVAAEVRGPDTARALLPPGRGRGSSVSSIVCFLTGLSHVDPIANELLIGRFLNEELNALPDIDLDFPRDIREVLIPRVHERYGHDRSALVAAFPTYRARGAIRELGKVLGLPPGEIERLARGSEGWDARDVGKDIENTFEKSGGGRRGGGRWEWLARLAAEAHGLPRHLSQHSGGMIVATRPLIDCCPIVPAAMEGRQIVMWDKDSCSDAGFLKIDLLGLGMLSAVERSVEMIARTRNERIDLSRIPYDDPATYECIQTADTTGVFQIESRAQMQSLYRTHPETLKDITIQVAIVRPGPIQGGAVNPYIERRQRMRVDPDFKVPYEHPSLEPVLSETLGTIIFQDQVLEVAVAFAGFSQGEAEGLRRAMSRKRSDAAIQAYHERFVAGAQELHGVDEELAERVFAMVQGFSGFGFPKAHGAAFGLLAYQSTWLRVHYGPEFLCSLLNEQPMGFYPPDALVHEAQRRGIEVVAPDVNESGAECALDADGRVRIGLGYVRGVRAQEVKDLVETRDAAGRFGNLAELASRAGSSAPSLELLAWSGACDSLATAPDRSARRLVLWQLGVATPGHNVPGGTQLALPLDLPAPPKLRELSRWDSLLADYATTGLTVYDHPMALLRARLPAGAVTSVDLGRLPHGSRVSIGGLVVARQRPGTANGIVFVLLEDEFGTINLIVPPQIYERHRLTVRTEPLMFVRGKLERHPAAGGAINVLVDSIGSIAAPDRPLAEIKEFSMLDEQVRRGLAAQRGDQAREAAAAPAAMAAAATEAEDFRAVAPAVMSFGSGRRR
ncbi:MAG TPA: DNA polymerase III subunit alpha [Solirubrobacteraceae bacterium]|nr:DNA polymerase III subunit alpha [Solirubrobacteraceae bacterium]